MPLPFALRQDPPSPSSSSPLMCISRPTVPRKLTNRHACSCQSDACYLVCTTASLEAVECMAWSLWSVHEASIAANIGAPAPTPNVRQLGQLAKIYLEARDKKQGDHYLTTQAGNVASAAFDIDQHNLRDYVGTRRRQDRTVKPTPKGKQSVREAILALTRSPSHQHPDGRGGPQTQDTVREEYKKTLGSLEPPPAVAHTHTLQASRQLSGLEV